MERIKMTEIAQSILQADIPDLLELERKLNFFTDEEQAVIKEIARETPFTIKTIVFNVLSCPESWIRQEFDRKLSK